MMSFWLSSVLFGIVGVGFLTIGSRGLVTKKPFLISARYPGSLIILVFLPGVIAQALRMSEQGQNFFNKSEVLILLSNAIVITVGCWQMIGYLAIGVTAESMAEATRATLQALNLPYQEARTRFRLTTLGADLHSSFAGLPGVWRIRMKRRRHRSILEEIVRLMNGRFRVMPGKVKSITCVIYCVLGAIFIVLALSLVYNTMKINGLRGRLTNVAPEPGQRFDT